MKRASSFFLTLGSQINEYIFASYMCITCNNNNNPEMTDQSNVKLSGFIKLAITGRRKSLLRQSPK